MFVRNLLYDVKIWDPSLVLISQWCHTDTRFGEMSMQGFVMGPTAIGLWRPIHVSIHLSKNVPSSTPALHGPLVLWHANQYFGVLVLQVFDIHKYSVHCLSRSLTLSFMEVPHAYPACRFHNQFMDFQWCKLFVDAASHRNIVLKGYAACLVNRGNSGWK